MKYTESLGTIFLHRIYPTLKNNDFINFVYY